MDPTDARHLTATDPHGQPTWAQRVQWALSPECPRDLPAGARLTLLYVAHRDPLWASLDTAAADTGMGASTIRGHLRTLEARGLIVQVRASKGGRVRGTGAGLTAMYKCVIPNPPETGGYVEINPPESSINPPVLSINPPETGDKLPIEPPMEPPPPTPPLNSEASAPSAPLGGATGAPPVEGAGEPSARAWVLPPFAWQSDAGAELRDEYLTGAYRDMDGSEPEKLTNIVKEHVEWVASEGCKQPDGDAPWRGLAKKLREPPEKARDDDTRKFHRKAGEAWTAALRECQAGTESRCPVCLKPVTDRGDRCEDHEQP